MMSRVLQRRFLAALAMVLASAMPTAVPAASHALIMAIDAYEGPDPLPGVARDVPLAVDIARRMGVPKENIVVRRNRQLTLAGMRSNLKELLARIEQGDQVFLYYSGHGARVANPQARSGCTEAMVTVNGELLPDVELEQWMSRLGQKAGQLVFMNDSCHSGGAVTRGGEFRPKLYKGRGASECTDPVNVRAMFKAPQGSQGPQASRAGPNVVVGPQPSAPGPQSGANIQTAPGARPAPGPQVAPGPQSAPSPQPAPAPPSTPAAPSLLSAQSVYIAASKEDEVAFTGPEGSVATLAWAACLSGGDGGRGASEAITAAQLRTCAQAQINQNLRTPRQNITIVGSEESPVSLRAGGR